MSFRLFSDANFGVDSNSGVNPAFAVGGVDFFITAALTNNIRALSESVLEILGDGVVFDLERIYLEWELSPALTLRMGRDHLMLGSYMSTFHHATLFQLATARPRLLGFEDEGGLLPAHMIGLEAFGNYSFGDALELRYSVGVGNGRGQFADDVLATYDRNAFKSVVGRVALLPLSVEGLVFALSGYLDRIPSGFTNDAGIVIVTEDLDEYIAAIDMTYDAYPLAFTGELYYVIHTGRTTDTQTTLTGGFAQLGYSVDQWTPYVRGEYVQRDAADPFFNASGAPQKIVEVRVGVGYSLSSQATIKVEYTRDIENKTNLGALQVAFAL